MGDRKYLASVALSFLSHEIAYVFHFTSWSRTPALSGGPHVQTPAEKTAYAVARLLQCVVRSPAPVPEPRMTDQGGDRAWSRGAVGVLRCPVLGVLPVLEVPLSWPTHRRAGRRLLVS